MTNLIVRYCHSCSTFLVQETASKKKTGRTNLINTRLALLDNQLSQKLSITHGILSKNALTN